MSFSSNTFRTLLKGLLDEFLRLEAHNSELQDQLASGAENTKPSINLPPVLEGSTSQISISKAAVSCLDEGRFVSPEAPRVGVSRNREAPGPWPHEGWATSSRMLSPTFVSLTPHPSQREPSLGQDADGQASDPIGNPSQSGPTAGRTSDPQGDGLGGDVVVGATVEERGTRGVNSAPTKYADASEQEIEFVAQVEAELERKHWHDVVIRLTRSTPGGHFVDDPWFNMIVAAAITLNGIVMGLEVDFDLGVAGQVCDHAFASVWCIEMLLRLWFNGPRGYFSHAWNCMDCFLALLSILDTWVLPHLNVDWLRMLSILRVLRVFRVVRLLKILRAFHELWLLVNGLIRALALLCWVVVLLIFIVYVSAIFMTNVVGKECEPGQTYAEFTDCVSMFGNIPRTMYTLFQIITLESWSMAVARHVIEGKPWTSLFFLAFVYLTTFGLNNIVMGVIVEQTLKSSADNQTKLAKHRQELQRNELRLLREIFNAADEDGGGTITMAEFLKTCERPEVQRKFLYMDLPVSRPNLAIRLFEVLDKEGVGEMAIEEFLARAIYLKMEGRELSKDMTLLLSEIRHLARRLTKIEKDVSHPPALSSESSGAKSFTGLGSRTNGPTAK